LPQSSKRIHLLPQCPATNSAQRHEWVLNAQSLDQQTVMQVFAEERLGDSAQG
jgi:hypothetical protein